MTTIKCPACSGSVKLNQTVNGVPFMKVCRKCDAVFGDCYLGDSYRIAKPWMSAVEPSPENLRYYDLTCLGSAGITRRHGWIDRATGLIVQVG
jgi:endogenous inhibitor of DNA gyrase (YacG/DUF329 family)